MMNRDENPLMDQSLTESLSENHRGRLRPQETPLTQPQKVTLNDDDDRVPTRTSSQATSPRPQHRSEDGDLDDKNHEDDDEDEEDGEGGAATTDESETSSARYRIDRLNSRESRMSVGSQFFTLSDLGSIPDVSSLDDNSRGGEEEVIEEEVEEDEIYEGSQTGDENAVCGDDIQVRFSKVVQVKNKKGGGGDDADDEVSDMEDDPGFYSPDRLRHRRVPSSDSKPLKSSLHAGKFSSIKSPGIKSHYSEYTEEEVTYSEAAAKARLPNPRIKRTSFGVSGAHNNRQHSSEMSEGEWTEVEVSDSEAGKTPQSRRQMSTGRFDSRRSLSSAISEYTEVTLPGDDIAEIEYEEEIIEEIIEEEE